MKKILIVGANSYIGDSVKAYLDRFPEAYSVDVLDAVGLKPEPEMFRPYDVVYCVTGIAHVKETPQTRGRYFVVNRDLVSVVAKAAKEAGVRQFILMSSMAVYGIETGHITKNTSPNPVTAYGKSKLQADEEIKALEDESFLFTCLRPPMVYGKGCKGNYQRLRSLALKSPVFPRCQNQRSMLYIDNLCTFVKDCIDQEKHGLFFPQNAEYTNTSRMVELIAQAHGKKIRLTKAFNWAIGILKTNTADKVFGSLTYERTDIAGTCSLKESIRLIEGE